ncbi:type IV pilus assembly protein PilM [Salinimonas sediminis]|uniref:Type IV pilus assembly protein PilM n=1 Tax=Salinimonas sediminis TaxID=2303538 RepID=A0A346NI45_9ALTE|nr:type IV pilus assembly protein PilM [Salinimonas sediminis]AXR05202.1 type IV pilus assembly protein PilM [Salinimonas sediminis]
MKSLLKKKLPLIVGLDIGTRQIKAVLIEKTGDTYTLQGFACESINKVAFNEREIRDYEAVSLALKKVQNTLKAKTKLAAIAVSGTSVISKVVHMEPDQTDFELEGQIEIEADSLIPYPLEEVYLDFEELGASKTHSGKVDVLLSAAHKDLVDSRITLVREVPLEPKVVDIEGNALGNALACFYPCPPDERVCCINIGASLLQVCVWENQQIVYSKEHNFGMGMLVQDISVIQMIERDEAERQLLSGTLPAGWQHETLPVFTANLVQQINRALQMYVSTTHAQRPTKLLLAGGGATLPPLTEALQLDLGIDIEIFNPFAEMVVSDKLDTQRLAQVSAQLAIAAGLASRSFDSWHI